jgi:hypothetical protein
MEPWNWELDDKFILTKNFKYLMSGLYYLGVLFVAGNTV